MSHSSAGAAATAVATTAGWRGQVPPGMQLWLLELQLAHAVSTDMPAVPSRLAIHGGARLADSEPSHAMEPRGGPPDPSQAKGCATGPQSEASGVGNSGVVGRAACSGSNDISS